jgi:hypothetical protein
VTNLKIVVEGMLVGQGSTESFILRQLMKTSKLFDRSKRYKSQQYGINYKKL